MGLFMKEKEIDVFGSKVVEKKLRPWAKWTGGVLAALAIGYGANHFTGDKTGLEKKIKDLAGISVVEKTPANQYTGKVRTASMNYFEMNGVEYVLTDFDARKLESLESITVTANPAPGNPGLRVVEKIIRTGADKKENPIYQRIYSVNYADSMLPDKIEYNRITRMRYDTKSDWEQPRYDKARLIGRINLAEKNIEVLDNEKIIGKVLISDITDYAIFQLKKQGTQEPYMIYIKRRDTVDWKTRQKTKELFYADIVWIEKTTKNNTGNDKQPESNESPKHNLFSKNIYAKK